MSLYIPDYLTIAENTETGCERDLIVQNNCPESENAAGICALERILDGFKLPVEAYRAKNGWNDPIRFHFVGTVFKPANKVMPGLPRQYYAHFHYYLKWESSWLGSGWVHCEWDSCKSYNKELDRFVCYKI